VAVAAADVVDVRDVGVRERRRQARLVEEHPDEAMIGGVVRQHALEHEQLLELLDPGRARQVDLGHAADGEAVEQLVLAQPRAGSEAGSEIGGEVREIRPARAAARRNRAWRRARQRGHLTCVWPMASTVDIIRG
jgi:hypothetical protein